jgi:hypothetical protein
MNNLINLFNNLNINDDVKSTKINNLIMIFEDPTLTDDQKLEKINNLFISLLTKSKCYVNHNFLPNHLF